MPQCPLRSPVSAGLRSRMLLPRCLRAALRSGQRVLRCWFALPLLAALVACGGGSSGTSPGAASLLAQATTAATLSDSNCPGMNVLVTVERVRILQLQGGKRAWTELAPPEPRRIDLHEQESGVLEQLGLARLAPGAYEEVRLILARAGSSDLPPDAVLTGRAVVPLQVPAGAQTGLRLSGPFVVPTGVTGDVVVAHSDRCDALKQVGNPAAPRYLLRPLLPGTLLVTEPPPPGAEKMLPLPGGAMFIPTPLPGFIVTTLESSAPLEIYADTGTLLREVLVSVPVPDNAFHGNLTQLTNAGFADAWLGPPLSPCEEWYATPTPKPCMRQVWTQAFTPTGAPIGSPLLLGTSVPYAVSYQPPATPAVAALAAGGHVVVWQASTPEGVNQGIWVRRFGPDGTPQGNAHLVWMDNTGYLLAVGLSHGGYAVVGNGKVAAFGPDDALLWQAAPAPSFYWVVGMYGNWSGAASATALPAGGLAVAWINYAYTSVVQYDGGGVQVSGGRLTTVDDSTPGMPRHSAPVVLGLPDGGYVVGWAEAEAMMARRFTANGAAAGPARQINLSSYVASSPTAAAMLANGNFMLSWGGTVKPSGGRVEQWVQEFAPGALLAGP